MDKFEEEVVQGTLSQGKPCNTSSRNICNELNDKGMKCTYKKKSGTRFGCVSASNQAKSNEKKYKTLIHVPTVMSLMQNKEPLGTLAEFRDILQDAFQLVDGLKQNIRRQFVLNIYNFYIVNFTHWNTSPKVAISLLKQCEKNIPALWFESKEMKDKRNNICKQLDKLANIVINSRSQLCLANEEDQFDFEQACYLDMISGECLENKIVVNQNRQTDKGFHTECYNPSTAKKLELDPFTREPFVPYTIDRPSNVNPLKICPANMSKEKCETFCRNLNYSGEKLARCLLTNKHWKKDISTFQKVKALLRYTVSN